MSSGCGLVGSLFCGLRTDLVLVLFAAQWKEGARNVVGVARGVRAGQTNRLVAKRQRDAQYVHALFPRRNALSAAGILTCCDAVVAWLNW